MPSLITNMQLHVASGYLRGKAVLQKLGIPAFRMCILLPCGSHGHRRIRLFAAGAVLREHELGVT